MLLSEGRAQAFEEAGAIMTNQRRDQEAENHPAHPSPVDTGAGSHEQHEGPLYSMPGGGPDAESLQGIEGDGAGEGRKPAKPPDRPMETRNTSTDNAGEQSTEPGAPAHESRAPQGARADAEGGAQRFEGPEARPPTQAPAGMSGDELEAWEARERDALAAEAEEPLAPAVGVRSEAEETMKPQAHERDQHTIQGFGAWLWGKQEAREPEPPAQGEEAEEPSKAGASPMPEETVPQGLQDAGSRAGTSVEVNGGEAAEGQLLQAAQPESGTDAEEGTASPERPRRAFLDWFLGRPARAKEASGEPERAPEVEQAQARGSETHPETTQDVPCAAAGEEIPTSVASGQAFPAEDQVEFPAEAQPLPVEEVFAEQEAAAELPLEATEPPEVPPAETQPVPEERLKALARESHRVSLLDDLSKGGEAPAGQVEGHPDKEAVEETPRGGRRKPATLARVGAALALIVIAVAAIKIHEAAELRSFLGQPIGGRAVIWSGWRAAGETFVAVNESAESLMTKDVPCFGQLWSLVDTKPENQPPPAVAGRYYYKGSWSQLLARLEAPPETLQLMLIPLAVSTEKEADKQEVGYDDVVVTITPRRGEIEVNCTEQGRWPPNEVFECFAYAGGETADAVRDINGPLALDTWAQAGRKDPKPVTEADLGQLVRVVNEAGRQVWPIKVETATLPNGAMRAAYHLESGTITVIRGALAEGRRYEEWSASTSPGYKLIAIWNADKEWAKDESRVAVLLGQDRRPVLAYGNLPLWPGTTAVWCRWYPGAGPQCMTPEDCARALGDHTGVQVAINAQGTVVAAFRPEGTYATLRDLLDPESEWQTRWNMQPAPAGDREWRLLRRLGYAPPATQ